MRSNAPAAAYASQGLVISSTVDVWYAGDVVARNVPVGSGRLVAQVDQDVPERLDITLPRAWDGITLDPGQRGVLGSDGHRLAATVHLQSPAGGRRWDLPVGRFQVQSWGRDGAGLTVMANGLLQRVKDHMRARPRGVGKASPIIGELMKELSSDGLEVWAHPSLAERSVPAGFVWGENRFAGMAELVTAWPARVRVDEFGVVSFLPPLPDTLGAPVMTWTDGQMLPSGTPGEPIATVISAPVKGARKGTYNHVIVYITPPDDAPQPPPHEKVKVGGRMGIETYGQVSRSIKSDTITTLGQAQDIAVQEMQRGLARARVVPVEAVPDWRVDLDDTVQLITSDGVDERGRVTGTDMPLTTEDGPALYHVGVVD